MEFFLTNGLFGNALPVNIRKVLAEARLVGVSYVSNWMGFFCWLGTLSFGFKIIVEWFEGPNGGNLSGIEK